MHVGQITLMLGLQVAAPEYRVFKFVLAFLQNSDGFGVIDARKVAVNHMIQLVKNALFHEPVAERHFLLTMVKGIVNDIFDEFLADVHDLMNVGKAHLRLHMPELGDVPWRVALFRAEGGTEGIDPSEAAQRSHFPL